MKKLLIDVYLQAAFKASEGRSPRLFALYLVQ